MAQNIFGLGMQAFDQGYDRTQAIRDQVTRRKAGQRLAAGDRTGASQAFASEGMIPEARQMQADQAAMEQDAYQRSRDEAQDQRANRQAEMQAAQNLIQASELLANVPQEQRFQIFTTHPLFSNLLPEEMRAQVKPEDLSDQGLAMFRDAVKRQMVNLGNGGVAEYDPAGGTPEERLRVLREPDYKPMTVGQGATLFDPDTQRPIYTNPKTYAPPRSGGGGQGSQAPAAGGKPWERKW